MSLSSACQSPGEVLFNRALPAELFHPRYTFSGRGQSHTNMFSSSAHTHTHTAMQLQPSSIYNSWRDLVPPSQGGTWRVQTVAYLHFTSLCPVLRSQSAVHDFSAHTHV